MSEQTVNEKRVCPRCNRTYKGHPALSRVDNETPICPLCGTRESLEAMGLSDDEISKIVGIVERNAG